MAGLTPVEVIELKRALEGMAECLKSYVDDLTVVGFSHDEAIQIAIAWQSAIFGPGRRDDAT